MNADDALYSQAVDTVIKTQNASPSMLQRKFRIGYGAAMDLLDEMAFMGIVSEANGKGQRKVLKQDEA